MKKNNYRELLEQTKMRHFLPDVRGKKVLDIGCGFGKNCKDFIERGALRVLGIDSSMRILEIARREEQHRDIEYLNLEAEKLHELHEKFDIVYSSLVFQYVEDFEKLVIDISDVLKQDGILLFSQEHPVITASSGKNLGWNHDEKGREISYTFTNYNIPGMRGSRWFIDDVIKYHRTMGEIVTTLARHGFCVEVLDETAPDRALMEKYPRLKKELLRPGYLIIRARKM